MSSEEKTPIVITPRELSPQEKEIHEVSSLVRQKLSQGIESAQTLADFICYFGAAREAMYADIAWMWQMEQSVTPDDVLGFFINDSWKQEAEKDAKAAEELKAILDSLSEKPGYIKMALKRIRYGNNYYRYGVLAQFPKGQFASDPLLGFTDKNTETSDIVFFHPTAACVLHACDDLFKIHRKEPFYIPYRALEEALRLLQSTPVGINEYQLVKTPEETVKQGAGNYILVGLHGAYTNEPYTIQVSRFWSKTA